MAMQHKSDKGRKTAAVLLCAAVVMTVSMSAGFAFAFSYPDAPYYVQSTGDYVTWTPGEAKADDTSSWHLNSGMSINSVEAKIDAAWYPGGAPIEVGSKRYAWNRYQSGFMYNQVKEANPSQPYPYAILYFTSYTPTYGLHGQWSPDCDPCGQG